MKQTKTSNENNSQYNIPLKFSPSRGLRGSYKLPELFLAFFNFRFSSVHSLAFSTVGMYIYTYSPNDAIDFIASLGFRKQADSRIVAMPHSEYE